MTLDLTSPAATGLILGLSAGLSPGPLLTLMLSETQRHGVKAGLLVAVAPLCTDLPIIALVAFLHWLLPANTILEIALGLGGGLYLAWLAWEGLVRAPASSANATSAPSLGRAMMVNLLNPNPYLFWMTIGVPAMTELKNSSWGAAGLFALFFYALLVGSKAVVAVLAGRSASFLGARSYVLTLKALSLVLGAQGLIFVHRALRLWTAL